MELRQYLAMFWRWAWLLALGTALAAGVSALVTLRMTPAYRATTTLMVGQEIERPNPQVADFTNSERLAQSYAQLVRRQPLLEATANALGLNVPWERLANAVNASAPPQTQLIQISVVSSTPTSAQTIADELARQLILRSPTVDERERAQRREFIERQLTSLQAQIADTEQEIKGLEGRLALENSARGVQDIQSQITGARQKIATWQVTYTNLLGVSSGGSANQIRVVEPAVATSRPVSPNLPLNVGIAAAIGFLLAFAAMLALEYLDDRLKTADDVARALKLPTLATVGLIQGDSPSSGHVLATLDDENSEVADAFRMVRTGLMPSKPGAPPTRLLVTSAAPAEGKTTSACNLATTVALAGKRVILCDADMRRPRVHEVFGLSNRGGLSTLLLDETQTADAMLREVETPGLRILPAGPRPTNPADLLGSAAMQRRVLELQELADTVIFDTPAVLAVTDAVALASLCSTAIIVVDASRMRTGPAQAALAVLDQSGLPVHGVVLNKVKRRRSRHYAYYSDSATRPEPPDMSSGSAPGGWRALVERFARPLRWPRLPGSTLP